MWWIQTDRHSRYTHLLTDAVSGASREGNVGIRMSIGRIDWVETLRIKLLRLGPDVRIAMQQVCQVAKVSVRRNLKA